MAQCKIKIIVGFRRDQEHTIDGDEAHKAYYLFLHPDQRGIFKNGLAIRGADIQEILPDWCATMGWNEAHVLSTDDWNEIRRSNLQPKMEALLEAARVVSTTGAPAEIGMPLSQLVSQKYPQLLPASSEKRVGSMRSVSSVLRNKNLRLGSGKKES